MNKIILSFDPFSSIICIFWRNDVWENIHMANTSTNWAIALDSVIKVNK